MTGAREPEQPRGRGGVPGGPEPAPGATPPQAAGQHQPAGPPPRHLPPRQEAPPHLVGLTLRP